MSQSVQVETPSYPLLAWRAEVVRACLVAFAVVLIALWQPIFFYRTRTLGSWDWLAQLCPLTEVAPGIRAENSAICDPVRQMIPWALTARAELSAGRVPLWEMRNGTGVPLLANYQSAVFSPFTLPFYVLPLKPAVLLSAASKLAAAAIGAYLFLRSLARSRIASALGSAAFALCGFHLMCFLHPHVGVLALLPAALLCVDRAAKAHEGRDPRAVLGWLAGLAVALGALVLAGHPESLLFCVYFAAVFAAFRIAGIAWRVRSDPRALRSLARFAAAMLVAGLVGGALGAVQCLPFLEYWRASASLAAGERDTPALSNSYVLLQLFPNLAGTFVGERWFPRGLMPIYQECNTFYVGGVVALLALASPMFLWRVADAWLFYVLGLAVLLYALDAPYLSPLLRPVFGGHYVPAPRSSVLWVLSACVLAAWTLDHVIAAGARRSRGRVIAWLALGVAALIAARIGASAFWADLEERDVARFGELAPFLHEQANEMIAAFAAGWLAIGALAFAGSRRVLRGGAIGVLFASVAAASALPFRGYVPTVDDRFVAPRTEPLEGVLRAVGRERFAMLTAASIQANSNLLYDVPMVVSYDAVEIRELDDLRGELCSYTGYLALTPKLSRRTLDLFGVQHVASRGDWLPLDTERCHAGAPEADARWYLAGELGTPNRLGLVDLDRAHSPLVQEFTASRNGLDGLVIHFVDDPQTAGARVTIEVREPGAGATLASTAVRLGDLKHLPGGRLECTLSFAPRSPSSTAPIVLTMRVDALEGAVPIRLFRGRGEGRGENAATSPGRKGWNLTLAGEHERGRILQDLAYDSSDFEREGEFAGFTLYRYVKSRGQAWIVSHVIAAADAARAKELVLAPEFDPQTAVVLEGAVARDAAPLDSQLVELESDSLGAKFRARCSAPAVLVLSRAFYPGWNAYLDGRRVPLLRANYAFCGVELPAGDSAIELRYEPTSFRIGWIVSLASLLAIVLAFAAALRGIRYSAA